MWKGIQDENSAATNISEEELNTLRSFKDIITWMIQEKKNTTQKEREEQENIPEDENEIEMKPLLEKSKTSPITQEARAEDATEESKDEKLEKEVQVILEFFVSQGEILYYRENKSLQDLVITIPMDWVRSLRTIISHKLVDIFSIEHTDQKTDLLDKGLLSHEDFQRAYNSGPKQAFTADRIWHFLIELGLACPLQKDDER